MVLPSRFGRSASRPPPPEPQKWILDQHGRIVARTDFYWDEYGVFGEAEGQLKYASGGDALVLEKERQELLEDLGLTGFRVGWGHVTRRRDVLRRKVLNAF